MRSRSGWRCRRRRSTTGSATCRWAGRRANPGQRKGSLKLQTNFRLKRTVAYAEGIAEFPLLAADPSFRDFVCLYIAEGYKRNRNTVSVANSDPAVIAVCTEWIRRFARHADQDLREIQQLWGTQVGVPPDAVRLQRKSNSGQLGGRTWRCQYGVLTVTAGDTLLRARLQAWIDCVRRQWLHSLHAGA